MTDDAASKGRADDALTALDVISTVEAIAMFVVIVAVLFIGGWVGFLIGRSQTKRLKSRTLVPALSISAFCGFLAFGLPEILNRTVGANDVNLGVFFLFMGIALPILVSSLASYLSPSFWIKYLKRNTNSFHEQIYLGFDQARDNFSRALVKTVQVEPINPSEPESLNDQLSILSRINDTIDGRFLQNLVTVARARLIGRSFTDRRRFDAVILMAVDPEQHTRSDEQAIIDYYNEIVRLLNMGVIVISIDTKFPKEKLLGADTRYLGYVTSDYRLGGSLIADRIVNVSRSKGIELETLCILGRIDVIHERVRHTELLYQLSAKHFRGLTVGCALPATWNPEECSGLLIEEIKARVANSSSTKLIFVYACDDNIANALSKRLTKEKDISNLCIKIVGYNGQKDSDRYLIEGQPFIDCTVDAKVFEQGKDAFDLVSRAYYDNKLPNRTTKVTEPELKVFV